MRAMVHRSFSTLRIAGVVTMTTILIAAGVCTAGFPGTAEARTAGDSVSVYQFVEAYQRTFNTRDPAALAAFFTSDADFMMFNLPEIWGTPAIRNFWQSYWQSDFNRQEQGRKANFVLNSIRFFSSNIALINIESITGGRDSLGAELHTRKARGTWLLQRQNDNWLILALCGMPTETDSIVLGTSIETAEILRPHIREFVKAYEEAYNSHDPSAVTAFFRDDADIVVRNSPTIHGSQAIQSWWSAYFSSPRNFKVIMIIDDIRAISDDVVQINLTVTGAVPGTEDEPRPLRQTRAMWILVRDSGKWRIAALRVLPGKDDHVIRRSGD